MKAARRILLQGVLAMSSAPLSAFAATDRAAARAIARRHIEEMWGQGRAELAYELYAPDVIDHQPAPGQKPGIEGILDVLRWLREAIPDLRLNVHAVLADPPFAADRWTITGTHTGAPLMGVPARGARVEFHGMDIVRLRGDGKITDIWHVEEFAKLLAQIRGA